MQKYLQNFHNPHEKLRTKATQGKSEAGFILFFLVNKMGQFLRCMGLNSQLGRTISSYPTKKAWLLFVMVNHCHCHWVQYNTSVQQHHFHCSRLKAIAALFCQLGTVYFNTHCNLTLRVER